MRKVSLVALLLWSQLSGCMSDTSEPADTGDAEAVELGETDDALVQKTVHCGRVEGFPTWTWWGWTTAEFQNVSGGGTTANLVYSAGAGGSISVPLVDRHVTGGRWGGLTLWVTYLGWTDAAGVYRSCFSDGPNPGAPVVNVQTY